MGSFVSYFKGYKWKWLTTKFHTKFSLVIWFQLQAVKLIKCGINVQDFEGLKNLNRCERLDVAENSKLVEENPLNKDWME